MRFTLQREVLLKPLQQVVNVVERRQTMPVLANVREDRQLITGQNPKSSREAAERLARRLRT